jgi:phenylpropionate dioxygenase-like ring-hydroxylating dioxygenase large terminal subunit
MSASPRYAIIDPATGLLDRRIFSDQAIYDAELERIFGRAWLMIGHESLVPHAHDFFHTYMGEDPVILTRDAEGRLHALLNMCRHRGNRVVRCDDGNTKHFLCTYHGWTYASDGALTYVPGESEAYYNALDKTSRGLLTARVDTYAGIVFATWAPDAPSLEAYLGDARWYLDTVFNRCDGGMQALGPLKWIEPVNWKTLADNCSDNYHVPTTHLGSARVQSQFLGRPRLSHEEQFKSPNKHVFVNGHSLTFREVSDDSRGTCTACRARPSTSSRSTIGPPCPRPSAGSGSSARAGSSSPTTASSPTGFWGSGWRTRGGRSGRSSGTSCCSRRTPPRPSSR